MNICIYIYIRSIQSNHHTTNYRTCILLCPAARSRSASKSSAKGCPRPLSKAGALSGRRARPRAHAPPPSPCPRPSAFCGAAVHAGLRPRKTKGKLADREPRPCQVTLLFAGPTQQPKSLVGRRYRPEVSTSRSENYAMTARASSHSREAGAQESPLYWGRIFWATVGSVSALCQRDCLDKRPVFRWAQRIIHKLLPHLSVHIR